MTNTTINKPKYLSYFNVPRSLEDFRKRYNLEYFEQKNHIDKLCLSKHIKLLRNQNYVITEHYEKFESELLINELLKLWKIINRGLMFYGPTFETKEDAENWLNGQRRNRDLIEQKLAGFLNKPNRKSLYEYLLDYYNKTKSKDEEFSFELFIERYGLGNVLMTDDNRIKFIKYFSRPKSVEDFVKSKQNNVEDINEAKMIINFLVNDGHLVKYGKLFILKENVNKYILNDLEIKIIEILDTHYGKNNEDKTVTLLKLTKLENQYLRYTDKTMVVVYNQMIRNLNKLISGEMERRTIHIMNLENRRDEWKSGPLNVAFQLKGKIN